MNNKYDTQELKEKMLKAQIEALVNTLEIMDDQFDLETIKKVQKKIEELNKELKKIKPNEEKIFISKEYNNEKIIDNQIDSLTYAMEIMENILDINVILKMQKKSEELELKKSNLSRKVI
jgi:hypothetical protein